MAEGYCLELIERHFGAEEVKYVRKKNAGGASNQKGTFYEDFFAAHRVAILARRYLETGEDPFLKGQIVGFVDDLVINLSSQGRHCAYQLKNSENVGWERGPRPIATDFLNHFSLARSLGYNDIKLSLVTSSEDCWRRLREPPESIRPYSSCDHFPCDEKIHRLLSWSIDLRNDFGFMSKRENCSVVDSEQVAKALMGAWAFNGRAGYVTGLIEQARAMSPTIVRPLKGDGDAEARLAVDAKRVLDNVEEFRYSIVRGFLSWSAAGTEGVLGYDCFDGRFLQFQKWLVEKSPKSFDDIEGWLI